MKKTHVGDEGYTQIMFGEKVAKEDPLIELLGTIDELNSFLGLARVYSRDNSYIDSILKNIQGTLFKIGNDIATPLDKLTDPKLTSKDIEWVENTTWEIWNKIPEPRLVFVYPGGDTLAAYLHVSRSICRRAERLASKLYHEEAIRKEYLVYLNRLSDLLFVLARYVNIVRGVKEELWP